MIAVTRGLKIRLVSTIGVQYQHLAGSVADGGGKAWGPVPSAISLFYQNWEGRGKKSRNKVCGEVPSSFNRHHSLKPSTCSANKSVNQMPVNVMSYHRKHVLQDLCVLVLECISLWILSGLLGWNSSIVVHLNNVPDHVARAWFTQARGHNDVFQTRCPTTASLRHMFSSNLKIGNIKLVIIINGFILRTGCSGTTCS